MSLYALCVFVVNFPTAAQTQATITPISVNSAGELGNAWSASPSISSDGRFVAFASAASNLVAGDTNNIADIFVQDRLTGNTELVSLSSSGEQANGPSTETFISANGRFVAFASEASNLVTGDTNAAADIFVHDRLSRETERVSVNNAGEQSDNKSASPSISGDGRYVAFASLAANLVQDDTNAAADIFIFDRLSNHILRASVDNDGQQGNAASRNPIIAANGRTVVFASDANNLTPNNSYDVSDIYIFNRVLAKIERVPVASDGSPANQWTDFPVISANGQRVAFLSIATNLAAGYAPRASIYIRDRQTQTSTRAANPEMDSIFAISGDGQTLAYLAPAQEEGYNIRLLNLTSGQETSIYNLSGELSGHSTLSQDGRVLAFDASETTWQERQVYAWDERGEMPPSFVVTGQVMDATGHPLALVTLEDGRGNTVKTDGGGYFYINGINPGPVTLVPFKEGYRFGPAVISLDAQSDTSSIDFGYAHDEVLSEAKLDIGMPYSFERGGSGPFHGFSAGYCTDLILDAYTWGVDFSIQFALEQDFRAHPWHFYRWRDARNAHDMWRYFSYSGQMLPHETPYQPGDIVFFDWSEDGEIDHVALVSEVNRENRPAKMYAATGVIDSNPGGLAAELPWEPFHERTVRGHARWSGKYEPVIPSLPSEEVLQMALGGTGVEIRLLNAQGQALTCGENEIPGGRCDDLVWEQALSVTGPFAAGSYYLAVITNPGESESHYQFSAQYIEDGLVNSRIEAQGSLGAGEIGRFPLLLRVDEEGEIRLQLGPSVRKIEGVLRYP
ncbi:MAG: DUF1287 domain-containing protein [Chloroflexota bacterium]